MNNAVGAIRARGQSVDFDYPLGATASVIKGQSERPISGAGPQVPPPGVSARLIDSICQFRNQRLDHFPDLAFSDPAWDILLRLYANDLGHQRITITELTRSAGMPATTVLRWLDLLGAQRLVTRTNDNFDARRVFISLSPEGMGSMNRYFAAAGVTSIFV